LAGAFFLAALFGAFFLAAFFLAIGVLSDAAVTIEAYAARRLPHFRGKRLTRTSVKCGVPIMPTAMRRNKKILP
jgi:hypothetical protein